jgi:hypothetical protein
MAGFDIRGVEHFVLLLEGIESTYIRRVLCPFHIGQYKTNYSIQQFIA